MKRFVACLFILLLGGICTTTAAFAELDILSLYGEEELVTIATGHSTPLYKAPAVSSVITRKDIEEMGVRTLSEALESIPGLHVGVSPTIRMDTIYSIRGIYTARNPHVLFMMNGVPFNIGSSGGLPILFRMPVASIERIEVIRGPGSAIYGADAFAGVVNIVTKGPGTINSQVGGRAGSFDTYDLWANHGQKVGNLDVALSVAWQKTNGDDDRTINSDYQTQVDNSVGTNVSNAPGPLSTGYEILDTHLELGYNDWTLRAWDWRTKDAGIGAGANLALDPDGTQNEHAFLTELSYENTSFDGWEFQAGAHYYLYETEADATIQPAGTTLPVTVMGVPMLINYPDGLLAKIDGDGQLFGADLSATYTNIKDHKIRVGTGYRKMWMDISYAKNFGAGVVQNVMTDLSDTPYNLLPDSSRKSWYASLQDVWSFAQDWELTAGVRYDDYNDFGSTVNPRIALVWLTNQKLTTKLMYGRAFRAPSFNELYVTSNPVELGDPNLSPEEIDTVELAFDFRPTATFKTALSLFGYQAEGLICQVPTGGGTRTSQNATDLEGYGFEIESEWKATESLTLSGNYSWQHSEDRDTGLRTPYAPTSIFFARSYWKFMPDWSLNSQLKWVGKRYRAEGDTRDKADAYTRVDLTLHRANIFENWDLKISGRNIFDESATEPSDGVKIVEDLPLEGRSLWAEVSYTF